MFWRASNPSVRKESLQSRLLDVGLRSDIDIRTGKPDQVILEVSEESDFDLIALATHGHQGVRRLMHKSVTEAIIRNAHAPVLAVKPARADDSPADLISPLSPARPIHRILALVDGSPESDCAAMTSAQLAKDVGATLHLLKVAPLGGRGVLRHADTPDNEDGDLSYVELLAASTRALGVETRAAIASAQGVGGMDAYIIQQKIDLVALATTTNPGVQRWMLAGVAEHLMRDDGVPVLLTCASHPGSATSLRQPPA